VKDCRKAISSSPGKSFAGKEASVKRLRAEVNETLESSTVKFISDDSGSALHISSNFRAGIVVWKSSLPFE
jgi:hypothetical protein